MKGNLNIYYDKEGDFLEIRMGKPTKAYFEELGDDIFERRDKKTNEIMGFAIFNFKKRTNNFKDINLRLPFKISLNS